MFPSSSYRLIPLRYRLVLIAVALVFGLVRGSFRTQRTAHSDDLRADPPAAQSDPAEGLFNHGVAALKAGDADQAIALFGQVIELDPKEQAAYVSRANAYELKKDYDRARADYDLAVRLAPKNDDAYSGRGSFRLNRKDYDGAVRDFSRAIRLNWKNHDYYVQRGDAYTAKGEFDLALADFEEAVRLDPDKSDGYAGRGYLQEKQQHYERALADYSRAVQLDPKDTRAYNSLAWICATCPQDTVRNGKLALDYALYVCRLTEWKEAWFFDTLAAAYAETGQFAEAVKWQQRVLADADTFDSREERRKAEDRLKLYQENKPFRDAK